jgi:glycerophosphoryl diester phosphodiesterase
MPALVEEAHDLKLRVVVWTVNKPDDMARMIDIGVDGIISDRPDLLSKVAVDKGVVQPGVPRLTPSSPK